MRIELPVLPEPRLDLVAPKVGAPVAAANARFQDHERGEGAIRPVCDAPRENLR